MTPANTVQAIGAYSLTRRGFVSRDDINAKPFDAGARGEVRPKPRELARDHAFAAIIREAKRASSGAPNAP